MIAIASGCDLAPWEVELLRPSEWDMILRRARLLVARAKEQRHA